MTCMFKGSLLLLPYSCTTPLPDKLHALTHPPSLLANWEDCEPLTWTNPRWGAGTTVSRIQKGATVSHFVLACLLSGNDHMLAPSWRENCLVKIFCLLCVCFWHQRVINSNNVIFTSEKICYRGQNTLWLCIDTVYRFNTLWMWA
jgi:hypothetical protein